MNTQLIRMNVLAAITTFLASVLVMPHVTAQEGDGTDSTEGSVLEEVVVTAQKRGIQNLQDVPVSMNVMSGIELDASSYEGVNDAIAGVPGVTLYDTAQRGGSRISIRGIASSSLYNSGSATTAYYLDEVPFVFSRLSVTPDANPYDLERVEVMKGPQGTLYGASSLGGVVRILTRDANLDEFELKGRADLSSTKEGDENYRGDVAVNVPVIAGKLAIRGVIGYQDNKGWIDSPVADNVNDAEIQTYRIKVGAQPIEKLRVDFTAWFSRDNRDSPNASLDDRTTPNDVKQPIETDYDLYGLTLEYDVNDSVSFVSSSSYADYFNKGTVQIVPGLPLEFDLGGGALNFLTQEQRNELFVQEIRLHSHTDGPWNWSIGAYYRYAEDVRENTGVSSPPAGSITSDLSTSKQYAVFGEVTRGFFDGKVDLTVGLRYFNDDVELEDTSRGIPVDPRDSLIVQTDSFDEVTSRVVLSWYVKRNLTTYATFSEGFRSGLIQGASDRRLVPDLPNVKPDLLTNYELGAKGTAADGRVTYDVALFYIDWEDVQQPLLLPGEQIEDVPATSAVNAGDASGLGVDAGIGITVTDGLTVHGSLGWNDLTFDEDVLGANGIFFAEGSRLDESAEWTANAGVDYRFQIGGSGYEGRFSGTMNYSDPLKIRDAAGVINDRPDAIVTSSIKFTVTPPSQKLSFTFYVDNLNDEDGIVNILDTEFPNFDSRLRPRTYGLHVNYKY